MVESTRDPRLERLGWYSPSFVPDIDDAARSASVAPTGGELMPEPSPAFVASMQLAMQAQADAVARKVDREMMGTQPVSDPYMRGISVGAEAVTRTVTIYRDDSTVQVVYEHVKSLFWTAGNTVLVVAIYNSADGPAHHYTHWPRERFCWFKDEPNP